MCTCTICNEELINTGKGNNKPIYVCAGKHYHTISESGHRTAIAITTELQD